ncbi:hypothetical protein FRB95_007372 [Tulasnella sp. JGI-2019a]|nr:hypothetical protein FRB93_012154 [Tulasnella sp. JGI-2019a]KAG9027792.1 hypothetical protein FRB95_007372 [Tulasnella sp. JGI-2019a]
MVRNTLPKSSASGPGGRYAGSSSDSSVGTDSPQFSPSLPPMQPNPTAYLPGVASSAQVFARRGGPVPNQTNPSSDYNNFAISSKNNPIIPAGTDFPVLLDSGVYVAKARMDIPYHLVCVRAQASGGIRTLRYAAVDYRRLGSFGGEANLVSIVGAFESYIPWIQAFLNQSGDWRFVDARQSTTVYNQGRLGQETSFLELLLGDNITQTGAQWMIPIR